jgi:hypothetical protein
MKVLLLSMPDSFEHTPADAVRMPNAALTSLAGNVDRHHRIAVADLSSSWKNPQKSAACSRRSPTASSQGFAENRPNAPAPALQQPLDELLHRAHPLRKV